MDESNRSRGAVESTNCLGTCVDGLEIYSQNCVHEVVSMLKSFGFELKYVVVKYAL